MKVKLNLNERLHCMQLMPKEGNFLTLKVVRDTNSVLGVKDSEFKEFGIVDDKKTGQVNLDPKKAVKEKEIILGEKATDLIIEALKKLNEEKKLNQGHFSLYEKFVEEKNNE